MDISDRERRKALGRRLAAIRRQRGLVQEDMRGWGINPRYYARVERGEVNVSFEKLCSISTALNTPLSHIFLLPLSPSSELASNVDELLAVLSPLIRVGNESVVNSLRNVIHEFNQGFERNAGANMSNIAYARKKKEAVHLRAAQGRRPYGKNGSKKK